MSEYMEKFGCFKNWWVRPPGYVGYEEGDSGTEARCRPQALPLICYNSKVMKYGFVMTETANAWLRNIGNECPLDCEDSNDALMVSPEAGIPFRLYVRGISKRKIPNPDVLCYREVNSMFL
ncbi:hypothetical protein FQA39_LY18751 [Lamprigera yunnana]|nr:hypothetical protein FQA39_LY18751 [Lamprigera yunnana]